MTAHLFRRALRMVFVVWAVSVIAFVFLRLSGDPAATMLPFDATPQERAVLRHAYGLDRPIPVQYARFLGRALRGDFGTSLRYRKPAMALVLERYPNTLQLALAAIMLALAVGIPFGMLSALRQGAAVDLISVNTALVLQSMPSFWLGIMLIILFAVRLGWLPTSGRGGVESLVLPAITLASTFIPQIMLLVRSGMADAMQQDYVRTAHAKGLPEVRIIGRHVFANILIPVVTIVGLTFGTLLGGAVVTETVFAWPGVGSLAVEGVYARDFPLVQAAIIVLSVGIVIMNLLVDSVYALLDPRVRRVG
ncbi:MAG: ABC transporter permease [Acidobacteria bacterium RBG_16_64_8]|nr:MAG: ABC transporter permease [Acidobacteria bacterium RBG_16_64_8]